MPTKNYRKVTVVFCFKKLSEVFHLNMLEKFVCQDF